MLATLNQVKELAEKGIPWEDLLSDEDEDAPSIFMPSAPSKWGKAVKSTPSDHRSSDIQPVPAYLNFTR